MPMPILQLARSIPRAALDPAYMPCRSCCNQLLPAFSEPASPPMHPPTRSQRLWAGLGHSLRQLHHCGLQPA